MSEKSLIELHIDLEYKQKDHSDIVHLVKYVESVFVPQHGMSIMIDEIPFKIKSIALAGLQGLKFSAYPETQSGIVYYDRSAPVKAIPAGQHNNWMFSRLEHFKKLGWKKTD